MRKVLVSIFFLVFVSISNAKSFKSLLEVKKDTCYVESYFNDLIIRLYSGEKTHSLDLIDFDHSERLRYLPNGYFNMGLGVNFRSFGLSLATKVPLFENSIEQKGETKRFGIQTYLYSGKFSIDLLTSYLRGYYLNNTFSHLESFSKSKEYQRPDISSANFGLTVNYIFNNSRFSYKAAFSDTERQLKNAGSLIAGGSFFSYQTKADSSFVPREIASKYFINSRSISKSGVRAFNANLGYAYSLLFLKNGIITMSYILGAGVQENSFDLDVDDIKKLRFSINQTGRLGIGYRFNRYYLRFSIISSNQYTSLNFNNMGIINGTNFMQVSLGKRISFKKSK